VSSKATSARIETIVALAKRRGFVFASGEIYGGTRSAWDYGPLGVELKENVKRQWWRSMVTGREDVVGLDSSVILPRQVWVASGHVNAFTDPLVECLNCHKRYRADQLAEEYVERTGKAAAEDDLSDVPCPNCGTRGQYTEPRDFNMMLKTHLGPVESEDGLHYLRPETAQGIFVNFLNVQTTSRKKPPFGIGPGRQELPQRDHPGQLHLPDPRVRADGDGVLRRTRHRRGTAPVLDRPAHRLVRRPGHLPENLRHYEHPKEKLSHYSKRTVDIEYRFQFTGQEWGELEGIANRTDFDLTTTATTRVSTCRSTTRRRAPGTGRT
jgi:glycyl-tRNA synthetase